MIDIWSQWLDDNFKYFAVALQTNDIDRNNVLKLATICEKYGVSFKTYVDILTEFGAEEEE